MLMILLGMKSVDDLSAEDRDSMEYYKTPERESWRVNFLEELIEARENIHEVPEISREDLDEILNYICTT